MYEVGGVPDGYTMNAAAYVNRSGNVYFDGSQTVLIEVQCLSLPVNLTVSKVERVQEQDWWTVYFGGATYHWTDKVTDKYQVSLGSGRKVFLEEDTFSNREGLIGYCFRVEVQGLIAGDRYNSGGPGQGSAPGLVCAKFWSTQ
jgi:hypothetical protein